MRAITIIVVCVVAFVTIGSFGKVATRQDETVNDKDIKLVDFQDMAYPNLARTSHIQGVVVVRAVLNHQGNVVEATAISGNGALIPDCLANAKKWRFQPNAEKEVVIVYNFRLTDAISKSGCSHFMLQAPNFATVTGCLPEIQ